MVEPIKNWVKENSTLVGFLVAQLLAIGALGASGFAYMIKLETRVSIMETRGAEYSVARMVAYRRDPQVLKMWIPMPHHFLPVWQRGPLVFDVPGIFRLGGVEIRLPAAMRYLDGV